MSNNYISKERVYEILSDLMTESGKEAKIMLSDVKAEVYQEPSANVVEVVRCKDCKHHEELFNNNDGSVLCWVHDIDVIVDRNGYCNYGEQKEQEHE